MWHRVCEYVCEVGAAAATSATNDKHTQEKHVQRVEIRIRLLLLLLLAARRQVETSAD